MEGHNPQPGPFPDGLGGFDTNDPIFADGFESGDVSAWSTGDPVDVSKTVNGLAACSENDPNVLCLPQDDRFKVNVEWKDFDGDTGEGEVKNRSGNGGTFSFGESTVVDLTVRLLDECSDNSHFWVFYAATTNVEFTLDVTDTQTSQTKQYVNALGNTFEPITDTTAFATCS